MKRIASVFASPPIRPNNGTEAFELLGKNKQIEVYNEVVCWFIEELEKNTDFSFSYRVNKYNKNWTTLYKLE